MMSVDKYKIQLGNIEDNKLIKIPLTLDFGSLDQSEVVNREFVEDEVEKSINPIIDYEQTRFIPKSSIGEIIKDLNYQVHFLNDSGILMEPTNYSDIGFNNDDIKFSKNRFKKSFLRLSFYDSDKPTNQNLISFITIFCRIYGSDLTAIVDGNGTPNPLGGVPNSVNNIKVRFIVTDPISQPDGFHEGFHLYYFKNEFKKNDIIPKELYMRAEFNNATTGKTTRFITTSDTLPINEVIEKLHTRYLLTRTNTGYFYSIDPTYNSSTNVVEGNGKIIVNLYEIKVQ
jgi:hypothetical protein|tara:strand:+ start:20912 stop:21766 length:855 start_codon:yes stop_codon:yes gene_type:complete